KEIYIETPNNSLMSKMGQQAGFPIVVVGMIDKIFAKDADWVTYLHNLAEYVAQQGHGSRLIPVAVESGILDNLKLDQQALRWDEWDLTTEERTQRLIRELAHEFSRILRHRLRLLRNPCDGRVGLKQDLEKIQVFLSHTKQDGNGKEIAEAIRLWLHQNSALASFMDVYDIPAGLSFSDVIRKQIGESVFLAIHTDHYSSREWCRLEVVDAKKTGVPMIVADCLQTGDERALPYLGNVPIIRMDPVAKDRFAEITGRLLDEVLANFLWNCGVESLPEGPATTLFMPRPPELLSLATLAAQQKMPRVIVYPDPPLGKEEMDLFSAIWGNFRILTMSQWLAEEVT
ncbi:MAG: toll/interleukin-1 receptor domain-containing protein, partial [Rhodothermaceae bacterium]|nr:toll/interleukin-1 receptor domain-containing protein [Rhodothermaceae bacterium]